MAKLTKITYDQDQYFLEDSEESAQAIAQIEAAVEAHQDKLVTLPTTTGQTRILITPGVRLSIETLNTYDQVGGPINVEDDDPFYDTRGPGMPI